MSRLIVNPLGLGGDYADRGARVAFTARGRVDVWVIHNGASGRWHYDFILSNKCRFRGACGPDRESAFDHARQLIEWWCGVIYAWKPADASIRPELSPWEEELPLFVDPDIRFTDIRARAARMLAKEAHVGVDKARRYLEGIQVSGFAELRLWNAAELLGWPKLSRRRKATTIGFPIPLE